MRISFLFILLFLMSWTGISTAAVPVAGFTGNPVIGQFPLPVQFTDCSTNSPTGWTWYFGDEDWTTPKWRLVNANPGWSRRMGHSSVVLPDGSIVLMGGHRYDGTAGLLGPVNDVWISSDKGQTWTQQTADAGWSDRFYHSSVVLPDGSIVLMGGGSGSSMDDVWFSSDRGKTWTKQTTNAGWSARDMHSSVVLPDGSIVLFGGRNNSGTFLNDVWLSTDKGKTWTLQNANANWSGRVRHQGVALPDGSIIMTGGMNADYKSLNDVWLSTDKGKTWILQTGNASWGSSDGHSSVVLPDGSIVLMGGTYYTDMFTWHYRSSVWRSTDKGKTWDEMAPGTGVSLKWSSRCGHSSVVLPDGSIVLMGGTNDDYQHDIWMLPTAGSSTHNPLHTYTTTGKYQVSLQAYNAAGFSSTRKTGYIKVSGSPWIGVFRSGTTWLLDQSGNGVFGIGDVTYTLGTSGDKPVTGDWNGNGRTEIGVWRPTTHQWFLDWSGNGVYGAGDVTYTLGATGDISVTGDWNGNGRTGTGVWRPMTRQWLLDKSGNGAFGSGDVIYTLGATGDIPVTGDWNGNGRTEIGVCRPTTHQWLLDWSGNGVYGTGDVIYTFGTTGDKPVTGDWNGNGRTKIGVWRPSTHQWFLDRSGNGAYGTGDVTYTFGASGDTPVTGDWSGASAPSIEAVNLTETVKPVPAIPVPGVSVPVSAFPRVEMPVKRSAAINPVSPGGMSKTQNPLTCDVGRVKTV